MIYTQRPRKSRSMGTRFITGANRGLGLEFVRQYAARGDVVHACCRVPDKAGELLELAGDHEQLVVHQLDVSDFDAIDALAASLHGVAIDTLINNAGVFGPKPQAHQDFRQSLGHIDYEIFTEILRVNTLAPVKLSEALLENIAAAKDRQIIGITSEAGSFVAGAHGLFAYSTSKAALNRAMLNLSAVVKDRNITVIVINPGWVKTEMGGPAAVLEVEEAIAAMIEHFDQLQLSDSGKFFDYDGRIIPW